MGGLFGGGSAPAIVEPAAPPTRSDADVRADALAARKRRAAAQERERTKHLRTAAKEAEKGMGLLTEKRTEIDRAMFDPDSATGAFKGQSMSELMKMRGDIEKQLEKAEIIWLEASEALEGVSAD